MESLWKKIMEMGIKQEKKKRESEAALPRVLGEAVGQKLVPSQSSYVLLSCARSFFCLPFAESPAQGARIKG